MMGVRVWGCEGVQIGMTTWDMTPTHRGFDTFLGFYGADEDRSSYCSIFTTDD